MSTDYADSYGQELFAELYAEWGKRKRATPPKTKKFKYTGSRKELKRLQRAWKAKEQSK